MGRVLTVRKHTKQTIRGRSAYAQPLLPRTFSTLRAQAAGRAARTAPATRGARTTVARRRTTRSVVLGWRLGREFPVVGAVLGLRRSGHGPPIRLFDDAASDQRIGRVESLQQVRDVDPLGPAGRHVAVAEGTPQLAKDVE